MNDNSDLPILGQNVDKSQVPPIEQKRMVAFINHFIINTVTFLNEFMTNVETKFVEFESKLRTIESSLQIVEAKMASIPDIGDPPKEKADHSEETQIPPKIVQEEPSTSDVVENNAQEVANESEQQEKLDVPDSSNGVKACDHSVYRKFFKMVQFGVPPPAVKLKMTAEGFEPDILDNPNRILEDEKHVSEE